MAADTRELAQSLARRVGGEVRFDLGTRLAHSTDASNYRHVPIGVVAPRDAADVFAALEACRESGAPVLARGAGTSLAGQACNVAVVLDFTRHMNRIVSVDPVRGTARVQPGVVLDRLQEEARRHGLEFGPDPATHGWCTLGGMLGNNAAGPHSLRHGTTAANVGALTVATYRGDELQVRSGGWDGLGATSSGAPSGTRSATPSGTWSGTPSATPSGTWSGTPSGTSSTTSSATSSGTSGSGAAATIRAALEALAGSCAERVDERYARIPRRVSGYNLDALTGPTADLPRALVGTEGTCAIFLEAEVALVPKRRATALLVCAFDDIGSAGDAVPELLSHSPAALEGIEARLLEAARDPARTRRARSAAAAGSAARAQSAADSGAGPRGAQDAAQALGELGRAGAFLIAEFEAASVVEAKEMADRVAAVLTRSTARRVFALKDEQSAVWAAREAALGASSRALGDRDLWPGWEDSAVHPERLGPYLRDLGKLLAAHGLEASLYGHFGDGCVHGRIDFRLDTPGGVARFRRFMEEAAALVVSYGGSLSGEHGDGQARSELLPVQFGSEVTGDFAAFKRIWDPDNGLNPGIIVDPRPLDADLRASWLRPRPTAALSGEHAGDHARRDAQTTHGTDHARADAQTTHGTDHATADAQSTHGVDHAIVEAFAARRRAPATVELGDAHGGAPATVGSLAAHGAGACVGAGRCLSRRPGVMCPSYRVTEIEADSTRGRARLLVELEARPDTPGLRQAAAAALDTCLGCKACRSECPAGVDMAAEKSRFNEARYRSRPRGRLALASAYLPWLLRAPAPVRRAAGALASRPRIADLAGRVSGLAPGLAPPVPAVEPFTAWFAKNAATTTVWTDGGPYLVGSGAGWAPTVLLWPDTLYNFFAPQALQAAVHLLYAAGAGVAVPARPVCCGRTLVDAGLRANAAGALADAAHVIAAAPNATFAVFAEPSCLAMFRDELTTLVGGGTGLDARPFSQVIEPAPGRVRVGSLAEVLLELGWHGSIDQGSALLHGHCHQTALWGVGPDEEILDRAGYRVSRAPAGCCGMAGSFGLAAGTAELGRSVGELGLLPAVRSAAGAAIVTDGFSCREQVRRATGARAVHLAEALWWPTTTDTDR